MELTLKQIAAWTQGRVAPEFADITVTGVTTDSRDAREGELFVPLPGETFDGHDYISSAMSRCVATLSERQLDPSVPAVYVSDTMRALGDIGRGYRKSIPMTVVGITGSVGKTTTKEMTGMVLSAKYRTAKTDKNFNNNIGLPRSILRIEPDCEVAVLEMGMNHFGEMAYLTSIALPDVVVITNIGTAHIEYLGSREGILRAKLEITEGMRKGGTLILNGDEPLLWNLKGTLPYKMVYFGIENPDCDLRAVEIEVQGDCTSFHVEGLRNEFEVFLPAPGRHNVYNALAALTVGTLFEVEPGKMQSALSEFRNTGNRQRIFEKSGFTIIDDSYNAGPESMEAALKVLTDHACKGRRIAVLGDMLELGNCSMAEHYKVGRLAAASADLLFTYGSNAERMVTGAITGGMPANCVYHFDSHEQMARMLRNRARAGDLLLFKGSHGMRMDHVLELFLNPEQK